MRNIGTRLYVRGLVLTGGTLGALYVGGAPRTFRLRLWH